MPVVEISGAVQGIGTPAANISGRFALAGVAAGIGALDSSPHRRVWMDVEGVLGEIPFVNDNASYEPADSSSLRNGYIPVWDEAARKWKFSSPATAAAIPNTIKDAWVPLIIGDGTTALTAGLYPATFYLPEGEIRDVRLWGKEASGSVDVDLWADIFANVPPTVADSITNANHLVISAARKVEKTQANLATDGWIVTVPAGGYFGYVNIVSVSTFTQLFLLIQVRRG